MKKIILTIALLCGASATLFAPPVPTTPNQNYAVHNQSTTTSSPIGTATTLLLTLGAGYTGVKVFSKRKKESKDNQE